MATQRSQALNAERVVILDLLERATHALYCTERLPPEDAPAGTAEVAGAAAVAAAADSLVELAVPRVRLRMKRD